MSAIPATPLLSVPEAAKLLTISERKLWDITAPRGPLPVVRIGRAVRYRLTDLDTFIEAKKDKGGAR
jgi:excisionase family DNA binding protein